MNMTPDPMRGLDLERGGVDVKDVRSNGHEVTVTLDARDYDWLAKMARSARRYR